MPALLHLQQNKPYILLDHASYSNFNIRPGKTLGSLFFPIFHGCTLAIFLDLNYSWER